MQAVWNTIYMLLVLIDTCIYKLAGYLYQIFLVISESRIFKTDIYETFISRVYVILGIIMLFFLAYSLLKSIVNPDGFNEGDTAMGKIISNTIISIIIIAVLPTVFDFLYSAQSVILKQNFIGKVILGNYSSEQNTLSVTFKEQEKCDYIHSIMRDKDKTQTKQTGGGCTLIYKNPESSSSVKLAGNSMAVDIYSAFFYPKLNENVGDDADLNSYETVRSKAKQEAIEFGYDEDQAEEYASGNQFYNKSISYETVKKANKDLADHEQDLNNKDNSTWAQIASYNSCHTMADGYIYGEAAKSCAADVMAYNNHTGSNESARMDIDFKSVLQYAKSTGDFEGFKILSKTIYGGETIEYMPVIPFAAGCFLLYIMVSYCIDMGLRSAKLAFAQLIAPVPILARIVPKQKGMFDTWFKFTLQSYFEVFLRVIVIFLGVFMVTHIPNLNDIWNIDSINIPLMNIKLPLIMDTDPNSWGATSWGVITFSKVAIIIGILMFMKQAPQLITQALGIKIDGGSLSIRNKLKEGMLGYGAASKVAGAATGGLGAGYMSAKNGGGFFRAAARGGVEGFKNGGNQFGKQGQKTYHEVTGDKYSGSFMPWSRRSAAGNMNARYDQSNKTLRSRYDKKLDDTIADFEANSPEFQAAVANAKYKDKSLSEYQAIRDQAVTSAEAQRVAEENRAQAVRDKAASEVRALRKQAQEYRQKESDAINRRKQEFENSREYSNLKAIARNEVRNNAQKIAKERGYAEGGQLYDDFVKKYIEKNVDDSVRKQAANSNSEIARQYAKDMSRNLDNEVKELKAQTDLKAQTTIETAKQQASKIIESANAAYDDSVRTINATYSAAEAGIREAASKAITSNPKGRREQAYADAVADRGRQKQSKEDAQLGRVIKKYMDQNKDK